MSYKCQECKTQQEPGLQQHTKVLKTRKVQYEVSTSEGTKIRQGTEIVKEIRVCEPCFVAVR